MDTITITGAEAPGLLGKLLDQVVETHEPVVIAGERGRAILIAEEDWRAVQETLHLASVPGMGESIVDGLNTPVDQCEGECGYW